MSLRRPQEVVEAALAGAHGEPCVVLVEDSEESEVRFANNTATTNGRRRDRRVVVIRFARRDGGEAVGVSSRSGAVDLAEMLRAAAADAESAPRSPDEAPLIEGGAHPEFGEAPAVSELAMFAPVVEGLAEVFDAAASSGRVLSGFAQHRVETLYLGTSTGLRRRHVQPTGEVQLVARSDDGTRSAWVSEATAELSSVDVTALEAQLTERLAWATRAVSLPEGRYEVVLPPAAVADLMADLSYAASGIDAEEGRSVFSKPGGGTRLGERLCDLPFHLYGDPSEPGLECAPFLAVGASSSDTSVFDNGASIGRASWVSEGTLANLRYHRAGATRAGVAFVPPVDNLVLELPGAAGTTEELVAHTERGLLLTCLWYIREVDPATLLLTGLTRDGVYLIEHGEVTGAVNNFRFNESPVDLLGRTLEVGASVRTVGREFGEWLNRSRMPPLRVADFNMSSTSEAS